MYQFKETSKSDYLNTCFSYVIFKPIKIKLFYSRAFKSTHFDALISNVPVLKLSLRLIFTTTTFLLSYYIPLLVQKTNYCFLKTLFESYLPMFHLN